MISGILEEARILLLLLNSGILEETRLLLLFLISGILEVWLTVFLASDLSEIGLVFIELEVCLFSSF